MTEWPWEEETPVLTIDQEQDYLLHYISMWHYYESEMIGEGSYLHELMLSSLRSYNEYERRLNYNLIWC